MNHTAPDAIPSRPAAQVICFPYGLRASWRLEVMLANNRWAFAGQGEVEAANQDDSLRAATQAAAQAFRELDFSKLQPKPL